MHKKRNTAVNVWPKGKVAADVQSVSSRLACTAMFCLQYQAVVEMQIPAVQGAVIESRGRVGYLPDDVFRLNPNSIPE